MFVRRLLVSLAVLVSTTAILAQEDESVQSSWTNELWREKLTEAPANSRWFVGANFGTALSDLNGDRAFEILAPCWLEIEPSVKKQILKGLTPGFKKTPGLNDRYFDILHLGMTDPDSGVQDFAIAYAKSSTFHEFSGDNAEYKAWRRTTRGFDADEIAINECVAFVEALRTMEPDAIPAALERLEGARNVLREHGAMSDALLDAGLSEVINKMVADGDLDPANDHLISIRFSIPLADAIEPGDTRDQFERWSDRLIELWTAKVAGERSIEFNQLVRTLAKANDHRIIPVFIGIIEADNSYDTIYFVGYFGLTKITGVRYSPYHDSAWWRRWWERNEMGLGEDILNIPIPDLPKTANGKTHVPFPEELDTLDGKLKWMVEHFEAGDLDTAFRTAREIADHGSPTAIPTLIAVIEADDTGKAIYDVGYFGLSPLTNVEFKKTNDGAWWRNWWESNKREYPTGVRTLTIPTLTKPAKAPQADLNAQPNDDPEFTGFPAQDLIVGVDKDMRYFLIGPAEAHEQPDGGYKLLLILPGGSGSADFFGFGRRIHKNALPNGYIVAQLVAPVWVEDENRVVWPTRQQAPKQAEFKTEDFIKAVVADVIKRIAIDERYVFALGWSSSGPPLYSQSMQKDSPITGTFIAMSVFRPETLPDLSNAKDHPYYLLHSPEDWIKIDEHARVAEKQLRDAGAVTTLTTYRGGHGWREDPFGHIKRGIKWLEMLMDR